MTLNDNFFTMRSSTQNQVSLIRYLTDFPPSQNAIQGHFIMGTAHESRLMCGRCKKNTWSPLSNLCIYSRVVQKVINLCQKIRILLKKSTFSVCSLTSEFAGVSSLIPKISIKNTAVALLSE